MLFPLLAVFLLLLAAHIILTWVLALRRGSQASRHPSTVLPAPPVWPFVSIIIPAWRERGTVETCIASLQALDYPQWECIIVAGGADGTYASAQERVRGLAHFSLLEQSPRGKNAALNQGLAHARGEVVVFLDADARVVPGWLSALVRPLAGSVQASTGNPIPCTVTDISLGAQMEWIEAQEVYRRNMLRGDGGIAVQRSILEQMGGLPEDVPVGVDWDLNSRLAARGVGRVYCPDASVFTELPATPGQFWRNELRWRRAHLASLFRLRSVFLNRPTNLIRNLYIYMLAWGLAGMALAAVVLLLCVGGSLSYSFFVLWVAVLGWVLLRRASLAACIAAYKKEIRWLKLVWVPPLLLALTLAAILPASLTLGRQSPHFKGPRSQQDLPAPRR